MESTAADLDFWVGKWQLTWDDTSKGTNVITKELKDHVIHERFSDPANDYSGESWSMFDPQTKTWRQTWVDTQGNYMTFEGGRTEEGVVLLGSVFSKKEGKVFPHRMVFSAITKEGFLWQWMRTQDDGRSWEVLWTITYHRQ